MSNKIIYPILIIIFSVLIIYGIINNRNNNKLNTNLESFIGSCRSSKIEKFANATNTNVVDSKITDSMINGSWTCDSTKITSDYNATYLMTINVSGNSGNVIYNSQNYTINSRINNNLVAVVLNGSGAPTSQNLHIVFNNNSTAPIDAASYKPENFNSVVSIYSNNTLINKFASYKVYNNKVGDALYRIVISGKFYIEKAPPVYDYKTYNTIISTYKFPSKYLSVKFGIQNSDIINTINTKYDKKIKFCMQRVFYSPTNDDTEIITNVSPDIFINVISDNKIPSNITICSFENDKNTNRLNAFFRPKATILYFYKYVDTVTTYEFSNKNNITKPNSSLNIKNNANKVTAPNLVFNDLGSVQKVFTNNYIVTIVNKYNSNLKDPTIINFSDLYNLL
jgi:hypothetical protein